MKQPKNPYSDISKRVEYSILGILFGCMFPILAFIIEILRLDLTFTLASYKYIHKTIPVHYIIDTAPIFLGLFAFIGGRNLDKAKKSNEELKKASKYREIFFMNMSHEIRTPMQGIIGVIDVLSDDGELNKEQKVHVSTIKQSSNDLLAILNDILDLSKLEAEQMRIYTKPMNLKVMIHKISRLFYAIMQQKKIELDLKYDNNIPKIIEADQLRITQIMSNLIGNAVKFMEAGTITITVKLLSDDPDVRIQIEIQDEGIGMDPNEMSVIFDSFKQAKNTSELKTQIKGTGLGLSISQKLAKLMGGEIKVKSELGKGSVFWFDFIAKKVENETILDELIVNKTYYDKNILLVDDSMINQKVIGLLLQKLGCKIEIANNGLEACKLVRENIYDMILMDINMPELSGIEATKRIKNEFEKTPIIIGLSANALLGDAERYIEDGMDDYLTKPITLKMLSKKFDKWFNAKN